MKGISIESIKAKIEESYSTRSAWSKGVLQYATEILDEIDGHNGDGLFYTEAIMKNGFIATLLTSGCAFDAWKQYSRSGSSLIFDEDIAKRLCSPSELKRTENGLKNPNRREDWRDVQGRALFQAAELIKRAVRELLPA